MSEMMLPMPEHWKSPKVAMDLFIFVFLALNVICLFWVWHVIGRRDYPTSAFAIGLLICVLFLLVIMVRARMGRASRHPTLEVDGTIFRSPRTMTRCLELSIVGAIVSGTIFVCYVPSGRLAIGIGGARQIYYPIIVAGLVCWFSYLLLRGRSSGWGYLKLSPEGLRSQTPLPRPPVARGMTWWMSLTTRRRAQHRTARQFW